VKVHLSDFDK